MIRPKIMSLLACVLLLCGTQPSFAAEDLKAFVANYNSGTVSVIDLNSPPQPSIPAPAVLTTGFVFCIAAVPSKVCVSCSTPNATYVIDPVSETVIGSLPVFGTAIAITPDGSTACLCGGSQTYIIDLRHLTYTALNIFGNVVAISPDGSKACMCGGSQVYIIDLITPSYTSINVQGKAIAITPDSSKACVCGTDTYIIDLTNLTYATLSLGGATVIITPDGSKACVANWIPFGFSISVATIDLTSLSITQGSLTLPNESSSVAITPDGSKVCVYSAYGSSLTIIDVATFSIVDVIGVGSSTDSTIPNNQITITPDGSKVCVCNFNNSTVSIVDLSTFSVVANTIVGQNPVAIAITMEKPSPHLSFSGHIKRTYPGKALLHMAWSADPSYNVTGYEIFGFDTKIATLQATTTALSLHLHSSHLRHGHMKEKYLHYLHHRYKIRAIMADGTRTPFTHLKIK